MLYSIADGEIFGHLLFMFSQSAWNRNIKSGSKTKYLLYFDHILKCHS